MEDMIIEFYDIRPGFDESCTWSGELVGYNRQARRPQTDYRCGYPECVVRQGTKGDGTKTEGER